MGIDSAHVITWDELKWMLIEEYFPINKMHKLEQELRKLNMKGVGIAAYTSRFNDHVTLCPSFVTFEYKKIERYIWGLA